MKTNPINSYKDAEPNTVCVISTLQWSIVESTVRLIVTNNEHLSTFN